MFRTALNPYWGLMPKTPQKAIYQFGQRDQQGLIGGVPQWVYADFTQLAAGDTDETALTLPPYFSLLGLVGNTDQETNPISGNLFSVELYDTDSQTPLIYEKCFGGTLLGTKGTAIAELDPHLFAAPEASLFLRVTNLAANPANIEVCLYGVMGGQ